MYASYISQTCCTAGQGEEGGDRAGEQDSDEEESIGEEDTEEDDESGSECSIHVRTGVMDEKASASQALGEYAEATGPAFLPYLEHSVDMLKKMAEYGHEEVGSSDD